MLKQYNTQLENAQREEISTLLTAKAETLGAYGVADYVGFVIDSLDDRTKKIDEAIKELQEAKKAINSQTELIKIGVSEWLTENGIDKLQGDVISSISTFNKKESYELVVMDEEAVINDGYFKMSIDKTATKQALLNGIAVNGAKLEVIYNEPSIKVNKKRKKEDQDNVLQ